MAFQISRKSIQFSLHWWPEKGARKSITNYLCSEEQEWKFIFEFDATDCSMHTKSNDKVSKLTGIHVTLFRLFCICFRWILPLIFPSIDGIYSTNTFRSMPYAVLALLMLLLLLCSSHFFSTDFFSTFVSREFHRHVYCLFSSPIQFFLPSFCIVMRKY